MNNLMFQPTRSQFRMSGSHSLSVDRTNTATSDILIEFDKSVKWAADILFLCNTSLTVLPDSVDICWILGVFSSELSREHICLLLREFKLTIANIDDCQTIELSIERGGVCFQLMRIILSKPFFDTCSSMSLESEISNHYLRLRLPYPVMRDHHFPKLSQCVMFIDDRECPKMLDACQLRVEELRRRLDDSLVEFQKSAALKERKSRSLHLVRLTDKEAMVEISEHGARPVLDRLLFNTSPLQVICDVSTVGDLASSPAESTDSGVSLSPVMSPVGTGKHSPFYQYSEESRLGMRQRSASESDWTAVGLKGILKKQPIRLGRFVRSISECQHVQPAEVSFSSLCPTLQETENENDDDDIIDAPSKPHKKHVSFSERLVELRRFRSNQCILDQAKKLEKKRLQRMRKQERLRTLSCGDITLDTVMDELNLKPGLRSDRQDSGFVDGEADDSSSPPSSPRYSSPEDAWKQLVKQHKQV